MNLNENPIKMKLQGPLVLKTVVNSCIFLTPDGIKQIVVGHRITENFSTVVKFHKHSAPQNGIDLEPNEWAEFISRQSDIDDYFQKGTPRPNLMLGSVSRCLEFKVLYNKRSIIISETVPPHCCYPRQIIVQENAWNYLKSVISVIDSRVEKCLNNEKKLKKLFDDICSYLSTRCLYFDEKTVSQILSELNPSDISNNSFSAEEFVCIFRELKNSCFNLIVNLTLESKIGFNFKYNY